MSRHPAGSDAPLTSGRAFVLLPGAWSGPWSWQPVHARLAELGHRVHAITFSGLHPHDDVGSVSPQTHVDDVLTALERHRLSDVVLVGHSYAGIIAGLVTDQAPQHVAHTVYVQGFLPEEGRSLLDAFPASQKAQELADIEACGGRWPPPTADDIAEEPDLSAEQAQWLAERLVPHPARTVSTPVALSRPLGDHPSTVITSHQPEPRVETLTGAQHWDVQHIAAGHWPMLTMPDQLTRLLVEAASPGPGTPRR